MNEATLFQETDEEIEVAERAKEPLLEDCKEESVCLSDEENKQTDNDRHSNTIYTKSVGR